MKIIQGIMALLPELYTTNAAVPAIEISGITSDSRKVKPGFLFFAVRGKLTDGHIYIDKAIANGAAAVIGEKQISGLKVPYFASENIRADIAEVAARFYKAKPNTVAIVTGTNGKTSTADFTRQFWELDNLDAASIGTLGLVRNGKHYNLEADNTSPDPIVLNELLTHIKDAAVIEGSSIGLEQYRLDGLPVKAAGFTNFTRDHLDYHNSMDEYFNAKLLLFTRVMKKGVAVLNKNIPEFQSLKTLCEAEGHKIISYGKNADLELIKSTPLHDGQVLDLNIFGKKSEHKISLVGNFQGENILCALGLVIGSGMEIEKATSNITKLKSISGRMEQAALGVFIDYAHTPDALETALKALRPHTKARLHLVFGCGGDRDKGKRPLMGQIANDLADVVIVTDDNPRTEEPASIRQQILASSPKAVEIADRKQAISHAVSGLKEGDILLIAGKGHEKYQIVGTLKHHFDDAEEVRKVT